MKKINKKTIINIIITIIYAGVTFFIMINHEPWRDEAQAWLIARDLSFVDIIKQMKFEGHPCLWHLVLMPFAKIGLPYVTLNIISWLLMVMSALIILFKSPFDSIIKLSILLSSPFIYFYISISRVYTLIAFLIICLASIYNERRQKPCLYATILLLLANTHIIMLGMVGILILEFYVCEIIKFIKNKEIKKNKKLVIGFFISTIGIILLVLQLLGSISSNKETTIGSGNYGEALSQYIIGSFMTYFSQLNIKTIYILCFIASILLIWQLYLYKYQKKFIIIFYFSIMFQAAIYVLIYKYTGQAMLTTYFIMLFCIWILHYEEKENVKKSKIAIIILDMLLILISLTSFIKGIKNINLDRNYKYSASREMAQYISDNIEDTSIIVAVTDYTASSIIPYCKNYNFYSPQRKEFFTYVTWDSKRKREISDTEFKQTIDSLSKENEVYILTSKIVLQNTIENMKKNEEIEELYSTNNCMIRDEKYYLYKIN